MYGGIDVVREMAISGDDSTQTNGLKRTNSNTDGNQLLLSALAEDAEAADEESQDFDLAALADEFGIELFQVKDYKKAFKIFDVSGDGSVDVEELYRVFEMIGDPVTMEQCEALVAEVDQDGSGGIDFRELVGMLSARRYKFRAKQEIQEAFQMLTQSKDLGVYITHTHLCARLKSRGPDDLSHSEIPQVVTMMLEFASHGRAEGCSLEQFQGPCHCRPFCCATARSQAVHAAFRVTLARACHVAMLLALEGLADDNASGVMRWDNALHHAAMAVDGAAATMRMVELTANPAVDSSTRDTAGITAL